MASVQTGCPTQRSACRRSRYPLVVLKPLVESQNAPALLEALPGARGLWMIRHYADVARSNLARFGDRNAGESPQHRAEGGQDWRSEGASARVQSVVRDRFAESMNPWGRRSAVLVGAQHVVLRTLAGRAEQT